MLRRTQHETHPPLPSFLPQDRTPEEGGKETDTFLSVCQSICKVASVFIEEGNLQSSEKNISSVTPAAQLFPFRKSAEG